MERSVAKHLWHRGGWLWHRGLIRAPRFNERAFRPYLLAVGQAVMSWNSLHLALGALFQRLNGNSYVSMEIWHSAKADRTLRDILLGALEGFQLDQLPNRILSDDQITDIRWACRQITALEDLRNDIVHTPYVLWKREVDRVAVFYDLGNRRAGKLKYKNLLAEINWCRDSAILLRDYVLDLEQNFDSPDTWPPRPSLPNRGLASE